MTSFSARLKTWLKGPRATLSFEDPTTPEGYRRALCYMLWFDHEILRGFWTNFHEIAPGVYRSNQPTRRRYFAMRRMGIRNILNLRGKSDATHYRMAEMRSAEAGMTMDSVHMFANATAHRDFMLRLIELFRTTPKPFVMHCKSGADRTGLASAIYLLVIEGRPMAEARTMLSPRYVHFRAGRAGVLDSVLDHFEERARETGIGFEEWLATEYDHEAIQARFDAERKSRR